ncbi:MAG: TonB family protein [Bacteroidia bacterium]|nr:TonB family protein [Bacteroidia bacterium]
MNDSLKHKIFIETDCISEQTMFDYIDKKLSARESHSVEKHLLQCELCSDALEGLELTDSRARISAINQKVREYIAPKKDTRLISFNYKLIISIAASVLLLIGGIFFFNQFSKKDEMAEFKSENTVSLESQPPLPAQDDAMIFDSTISNSLEVAKEENTSEAGKGLLDKMEEEEPSANAEGQGAISQSDQKTRIVTGEKAADNAGASYYPITEEIGNKKGTGSAPIKSDNIAPKSELNQHAKDGNFAEMKNAGAAGGVADERDMEVTESTAASSKTTSTFVISDSDDMSGDKVAKKSTKANGLFRSESKEKRKAESVMEDAPAESIAYAPQSIVTDTEMLPTKTADPEPDQLQDELKSVDQMPEFPGGQDSLLKFIHKNFKYPANYKAESSNKKIDVNFIVDKDGKIKKAKIVKGLNSELDKEALRVVNIMPKWKAGFNNGKPVSVNFDLPIILE